MICKRCGNSLAENATICPICGTPTILPSASRQPSTGYGPFPQSEYNRNAEGYEPYDNPGRYERGYAPPPPRPDGPQQDRQGYEGHRPNYGYAPPFNAGYTPNINVTVINNAPASGKNDSALIVEIILSLFGIFGVGWLMAGETTTGIILLVCSFVLYWPIIIMGTLFTFGVGLLCLGPMMIAAIITNAVLLNNALKRKAAQPFVYMQPPMQMPPQR
jgi:TM2 domain-containing membrane protein YozV